jgi:hypothetical protein
MEKYFRAILILYEPESSCAIKCCNLSRMHMILLILCKALGVAVYRTTTASVQKALKVNHINGCDFLIFSTLSRWLLDHIE